jgi:FkbM family methyltransferase
MPSTPAVDTENPLRSKARTILRALIIGFVAFDALALVVGIALVSRSECSLRDIMGHTRQTRTKTQIAQKIHLKKTESGLDLWSTPQGDIWTVHDDEILPFLLWEQQRDIYEPDGHEVQPGDTVLDCGANIGVFTRKALSRGAARVVSIDPAPQTLNALRRNFETEIREGRVIVYPKGVWDQPSEMELRVYGSNAGANSLVLTPELPATTARVPLTTIDAIVDELKLSRVDFIKMDIEGSEKRALAGAKNTINRFRPRMSISTEHLPDDYTAIPALVNSIAPNYTHRGCDCLFNGRRITALVMAFDPAP